MIRRILLGEAWQITVVLLLALVHGLGYLFLIPPWQHYDETNNFEYVWLLANQSFKTGEFPQPGDYDQSMRREVAQSMIEHGFFRQMGFLPDLEAVDRPIWIGGYSQLADPPLYYLMAAGPVWLMKDHSIDVQLYAARFVSLGLFLVSIVTAWGMMREITAPGNPLRWMAPASMALIPSYVDMMTAVNNDVAASAFFALFLWGCIRLVQRGLSLSRLAWVCLALALSLMTKRNTYLGVPLLGLVLALALFSALGRRLPAGIRMATAWGGGLCGGMLALAVVFSWGDAWLWARRSVQPFSSSAAMAAAPLGERVFRLQAHADKRLSQLVQVLPLATGRAITGQRLTLGMWVWADQPAKINSPAIFVSALNRQFSQPIDVGTAPHFFAFSIAVDGDMLRTWITLDGAAASLPVTVYYDGLVLVEGDFTSQPPPVFADPDGRSGQWGGIPFRNLLRNASAEAVGLAVRPWVDQLSGRLFSDYGMESLSMVLYTMADWPATGWYYQSVVQILLRSFWAKFGWGQVSLLGAKPYRALFGLTGLGVVGAALVLWRGRRLPWRALLVLGAALVGLWAMTIVRGSNYVLIPATYFPVARYAFPVMIPTVLALNAGWLAWFGWLQGGLSRLRLRLPVGVGVVVFMVGFLWLDLASIISIWHFYYAA